MKYSKTIANIHYKMPYIEVAITLFFGIFLERFTNRFMDNVQAVEKAILWYKDMNLYLCIFTCVLLILYFKNLSSIRYRKAKKLQKQKDNLRNALFEETIKEIRKEDFTIQEKAEFCKLVILVDEELGV